MASREPRRYLFACGTDQYTFLTEENEPLSPLQRVQEDIQRMTSLLSRHFGYERILGDISVNPTKKQLETGLENWLKSSDLNRNDCLIFYYAGHGLVGDDGKHYLILKETKQWPSSKVVLTNSLITPLFRRDINIPKVLYIIDTCESGKGAYELIKGAFNLQNSQSIDSDNSVVIQAIASCRSRQYAQDGAFSRAFEEAIEEILGSSNSNYIYLEELVPYVANRIGNSEQECEWVGRLGKEEITFFPIQPGTIKTWEGCRKNLVKNLVDILSINKKNSVLSVNSFVLSQGDLNLYSKNQVGVENYLTELSIRQVTEGICPLVACSEWCQIIFSELSSGLDIRSQIQSWQQEVAKYRVDLDLDRIRKSVRQAFVRLKKDLQEKELRLQISLEPEYDLQKNTGKLTGDLLVSMELYVQGKELPLGRFAERELLRLPTTDKADPLCCALEEKYFLSNLIQLVLESIYIGFELINELVLEFFLPIEYYLSPIDRVKVQYDGDEVELGRQYQVIINSYQRYFDRGRINVRRHIDRKKIKLWKKTNYQPQICDELVQGTSEVRKFKPYDIFKGALPSKHLLKMIERDLSIAVWCRNSKHPLQKDDEQLPVALWSNWPEQLYDLRDSGNTSDITLFWDDLSPKPKYPKPLNIEVVKK